MRILKRNIALIMLLVMVGNFFIAPISNVYAASSNEVQTYIATIDANKESLNTAINIAKLGTEYMSNPAYKYAVDRFEEEALQEKNNYENQKLVLGTTISLEKLLTDSSSPYLSDYNNYFTADVILSLSLIEDITYSDGTLDKTITGEELATLVTETYLKSHSDKLADLSTNYGTYIANYQSFYNDTQSAKEDSENIINGYITEVNNYKTSEEALGNTPDMTYNDEDVITKLNSYIEELTPSFETIINNDVYNNEFDTIVNDAKTVRDGFFANNSNITSEITTEIENLTTEYKNFETSIKDVYSANGLDYENKDYTNLNTFDNAKIESLTQELEKGLTLEENYQNLNNKIEEYLSKRPSETSIINPYMEALNEYHNKLNKENMMKDYSDIVYNANIEQEEIVDTLLAFTGLEKDSEEYKYLFDAKLSFYNLELKDDSVYQIEVKDNYLVINGSSNIKAADFNENIKYDYNFNLTGTNEIIDNEYKLELFDKNEASLITLNLLIKNDVNGDGLIDQKDLDTLKDKILKNETNEIDKIISDVNNDEKVNILDLTALNNIVNSTTNEGVTTEASFDIVTEELDNQVIYKIYLKTDGIVSGFEFNISSSSNLKLLQVKTSEGVVYQNNESNIKVIGLGNYENEALLITLTYERQTTEEDTKLELNEGIISFDNEEYTDNITISNLIPATVVEKQETSNETEEVTTLSNVQEQTTKESKKQEEPEPRESVISGDELDKEDVVWGNIIKIALIVLLGALIIYFLNKDNEEKDGFFKEEKENKEESKKEEVQEEKKKEIKEEPKKQEVKKENNAKNNNNKNNNKYKNKKNNKR